MGIFDKVKKTTIASRQREEILYGVALEEVENNEIRKGLYAKARSGEIPNFTGISSPFEKPINPEIRIDTLNISAEEAADQIIEFLSK